MILAWNLPAEGSAERADLWRLLETWDLDGLAHRLQQYVTGPVSHDAALAALMDMAPAEYLALLKGRGDG